MDCPQTEQLSQPGFFERIKASEKRIPLAGSLEVTQRCNLRCVHCYLGDHRKRTSQREMSGAQILPILDQVAEAGTLWFLFTGGEPFLRPDFMEIYQYAVLKGLLVTIFSNGTLLTPAVVDQLADLRPQSLEITLYGATQETYESITGIPGSFQRCRQGIDLLLQRSLPLKLKTMAMKLNRHEVEAMQAFAGSLGVPFRYDPLLVGSMDGANDPTSQRLSAEEVVHIDISDPIRLAEWKELFRKKTTAPAHNDQVYLCGAGRNTYHIDPFGRLTPCILSRDKWYNLVEGSFFEGWNHYLSQVISEPANPVSPCISCNLHDFCGQCPGKVALEGAQINQRIDYFCQVGHLRASAFREGWQD